MTDETPNQPVLKLLNDIADKVRENPDADEMMAIVKIGDDYHRFSTGIRDVMGLISTFELAKYDILRRMGG